MALGTNALSRVWAIGSQVSTKPGAGSWKMKMCLQGVWEAETLTWSKLCHLQGSHRQRWLGAWAHNLGFSRKAPGLSLLSELGEGETSSSPKTAIPCKRS